MRCILSLTLSTVFVVFSPFPSAVSVAADSMDWPSWRGPEQNGISRETGIVESLDLRPSPDSNLQWKSEEAAGISTPIVMNGRLYTIVRDQPGTPNDREKILCLDAATGEKLWENHYNVFLSDVPAERIGWSNCAGDPETGNVYALGACSLLLCVDGQTGETVWSRSLSEEFGMLSTYGGRTNTPVLFENLVIISGVTTGWDETARPAHRFLAFDKDSGELLWLTSTRPLPEDTTYSTPVIGVVDRQHVLAVGSGDGGLYAMQPRTGKILWRGDLSRRGVNTSPILDDAGIIYGTHGEENVVGTVMGGVVAIDGPQALSSPNAAERWRSEGIMAGKSSPLLVDGRLYVVEDSAALHVLDAATGEAIGRRIKLGTAMRASLLWADGKIYACTSSGICHILRPTEEGVETVFKVRLPRGHDIGGSPIVSHGRLYIPTTGGLFCFAKPGVEPHTTGLPDPPAVTPVASDLEVAQLQLAPAEAISAPGETVELTLRQFNAAGQLLESNDSQVTYTVEGTGSVDAAGRFTTEPATAHTAATVVARSGDLSTHARLRIIPPLPWQFDFREEQVPITWIGARYRHEATQVENDPALVKISTIPKGTRSQSWMGPADLHDYTIQADVRAVDTSAKLPDMGIIGQRYTLDLMGELQQLQIRTWAAQLRMARSTPVKWQAGVWYTLKLRAENGDGIVTLRGKVWPRDEPEPEEWTVTATDTSPNSNGSPGLFGNSTNGEFVIDNVVVTPNE